MFKLIYASLIILSGCNAQSTTVGEPVSDSNISTQQIQQNPTINDEELGTEITLTTAQVEQYQDLELRLLSIEDSRCATGVTCIWAGQLVVTLQVSSGQGEQEKVKLIRKREPEIANVFGYSLFLLDVEPYPKEGKVISLSEQRVKLNISKN
jgi:hypothetical protein